MGNRDTVKNCALTFFIYRCTFGTQENPKGISGCSVQYSSKKNKLPSQTETHLEGRRKKQSHQSSSDKWLFYEQHNYHHLWKTSSLPSPPLDSHLMRTCNDVLSIFQICPWLKKTHTLFLRRGIWFQHPNYKTRKIIIFSHRVSSLSLSAFHFLILPFALAIFLCRFFPHIWIFSSVRFLKSSYLSMLFLLINQSEGKADMTLLKIRWFEETVAQICIYAICKSPWQVYLFLFFRNWNVIWWNRRTACSS